MYNKRNQPYKKGVTMKKRTILSRILCIVLALVMTSCTNNATDTIGADGTADISIESGAETTAETSDSTSEWKPMTNEELVDRLLQESKIIADFIRDNGFEYGDAKLNPGVNWRTLDPKTAINPNERIVACDRLVQWALFRVGFTDQTWYYGIRDFDKYAEEHGFIRITSIREVRKGDLVSVHPNANGVPQHIFICAGDNLRYDAGSLERINGSKGAQPFREPIINFVFAWRPVADKMPNPNEMDKVYALPDSNVASISENATVITTENDKDNTFTVNKEYTMNDGYSSYEFHLNLSSKPSSQVNQWTGTYIGARISARRDTPSSSTYTGGIWVGVNGSDEAILCMSTKRATLKLPEATDTPHKYIVVDTENTIKYYMETSDGTRHLFCTVTFSEEYDQICVRDASNKIVFYHPINIDPTGYFKVWACDTEMTATNIEVKGVAK